METSIPRKRGAAIAGYDKAMEKFFDQVMQVGASEDIEGALNMTRSCSWGASGMVSRAETKACRGCGLRVLCRHHYGRGFLHTLCGGAISGALWCCAVLCCAVLCCAVLCCAVPCCDLLCFAVLCCAAVCRIVHSCKCNERIVCSLNLST